MDIFNKKLLSIFFFIIFLTTNIFANGANYLQETSLVKNRLLLTFKYKLSKVNSFSLKKGKITKYIYDIDGGVLPKTKKISHYRHKHVKKFRMGQYNKEKLRVVLESSIASKSSYSISGKVLTIYLPKGKSLSGKLLKSKKPTIIIDAGHGGRDRGAFSKGKKEKSITLKLAHKLKRELTSRGYRILMTRTHDTYLSLKQRTEFANAHRGDIFLSIHTNAAPKKRSRRTIYKGVEIFYLSLRNSKRVKHKRAFYKGRSIYSKKSYRQMISKSKLQKSNRLAKKVKKALLRSVRSKYRVIDKGIKRSDFWVLLATKMPSILIEAGYLTDKYEGRRLVNNHYQNLLVNGIANGVDNYYK